MPGATATVAGVRSGCAEPGNSTENAGSLGGVMTSLQVCECVLVAVTTCVRVVSAAYAAKCTSDTDKEKGKGSLLARFIVFILIGPFIVEFDTVDRNLAAVFKIVALNWEVVLSMTNSGFSTHKNEA